jgi:hypothetical protein
MPHFTTEQTRKQGNKWHEPHHTSINKIAYSRIDYIVGVYLGISWSNYVCSDIDYSVHYNEC